METIDGVTLHNENMGVQPDGIADTGLDPMEEKLTIFAMI